MSDLNITANPIASFTGAVVLCSANAAVSASATTAFESTVMLSSRNAAITAAPCTYFAADVTLSSRNAEVTARPLTNFEAVVQLSSRNAAVSFGPMTDFKASVALTGASDSHGMSVPDVVKEMLGLCGIFCLKSAPDFVLEWAINGVNASLQTVWNHADDRNYWSSDTMTIELDDGEDSFDLPNDIQNVVGPCRLASNLRPLVPIGTIGELETFADLYLDGETAAEPLAYHINRMEQAGNDPAKCVFNVTPAVSGGPLSFLLEVVREAPRYNFSDLQAAPVIPIPHRYVESLLLPIAKYHASSFSMFIAKDQKETIDRDYQAARVALGLSDPLPGKAGDNINKREQSKS